MAFYPVIKLANRLRYPGFIFKLPIANSEDLPDLGNTIYAEWNEIDSVELPGW